MEHPIEIAEMHLIAFHSWLVYNVIDQNTGLEPSVFVLFSIISLVRVTWLIGSFCYFYSQDYPQKF